MSIFEKLKRSVQTQSSPSLVSVDYCAARRALEELRLAESYFNVADTPETIDYATFQVEAARRKYEFLINRARENEKAALQNADRLLS